MIVEDNATIAAQLQEAVIGCLGDDASIKTEVCPRFSDALDRLRNERFDLLILDLKDDCGGALDAESVPAGVKVLNELKAIRFLPIVVYSAIAYKLEDQQTSFVRIVNKRESVLKVNEEINAIFSTKLPELVRRIDELQRSYMWDFVGNHWSHFDDNHQKIDLAYLLARRLAIELQANARNLTRTVVADGNIPIADPKNVHPMEMFIHPPINNHRLSGDILKVSSPSEMYWIVLTPSCDFSQNNAEKIVLAQCLPLKEQIEYSKWMADKSNKKLEGDLKALLGDNRSDSQRERYKFLPGTYFLPDLVVDFQKLRTADLQEVIAMECVASLDSPFAEAVVSKFSRYFGRLGTPDLDRNIVLNRLKRE